MARMGFWMALGLPGIAMAVGFDHGPLVQWSGDPKTTAQIRWIERAEDKAVEGRWAIGPAGFGYGDGDDATVLPGMAKRYGRLAIRRQVELPEGIPADTRLYLRVNYDDGFIAWLGGKEVARRNVTGSADGAKVPDDHEAGDWEEIILGKAGDLLGGGGKVLALEGYNVNPSSSDFTLDVEVVAKHEGKTVPVIAKGARWEYLAGRSPEDGWQAKGGVIDGAAVAKGDRVAALRYRAKGSAAWKSLPVDGHSFAGTRHRVRSVALKQLPPGTDIEFQLTAGDGSNSAPHRFRTMAADDRKIRFVTGGDLYHKRAPMDAMNRRAGMEDPMFALLGGDLAYTNNAAPERWFDFIDSWVDNACTPDGRLLPMVLAIGNHEVIGGGYRPNDAPGAGAATEFFSLFHMRREGLASDCFDIGKDFSIVLLDSGHAATIDSQTEWLDAELSKRRGVKRLFVCYHRPAWGCGAKEDAVEIQRAWCPLFDRFRVDGVFENDHHTFSRSHPLLGGRIDEARGIPYLGSGAWSVDVRAVDPAQLKKRPWIAKALAVNHLYVVEAGDQGWTATAKTADGKAFDRIERPWRR